jgi:HEAT repeat protein
VLAVRPNPGRVRLALRPSWVAGLVVTAGCAWSGTALPEAHEVPNPVTPTMMEESVREQPGRELDGGEIPDRLVAVLSSAGVALEVSALANAAESHPDVRVRAAAAQALAAWWNRGDAQAALRQLLPRAHDDLVRLAAASALAKAGDELALATLREMLVSTREEPERLLIAAELAEAGHGDGYRYVLEIARAKEPRTRAGALRFLVSFFGLEPGALDIEPQPADLLARLARDESAEVREEVVLYLPSAVDRGLSKEAAEALARERVSRDPSAKVREAAQQLLDAWEFDEAERKKRETE